MLDGRGRERRRRLRGRRAFFRGVARYAIDHLRALSAGQRRLIVDTVDRQLAHRPDTETRNRKPMRPDPLALWELRVGDLRVYYDVETEPERTVVILAVGVKDRNQIRIGGEVVDL